MPESVESPAPVSTTSGRSSRRSSASLTRSSPGVPQLGAGLGLRRLHLAVLGWRGRDQVVEQVLGDVGDLLDRPVERLLVRLARFRRTADLADVLQCSRGDLVAGRGRLEVVERADVPAHGYERTSPTEVSAWRS